MLEEERFLRDPKNTKQYAVKILDLVKLYKKGFKVFKQKKRKKKITLRGIGIGIEKGQIFGLLGTNGAGKSTIFNILTGQIFPDSGLVEVMGLRIPQNIKQARQLLGYSPQKLYFYKDLTVKEHFELFSHIKGINPIYHKYLIQKNIINFSLRSQMNQQLKTLSEGYQKRLSIAIAILGKPPLLLLDEPSTSIDPRTRRYFWKSIQNLLEDEKDITMIFSTHYMEEAEKLAKKIAIMSNGQIRTIGSVQELKERYGQCFELTVVFKSLDFEQLEEYKKMNKKQGDFQESLDYSECAQFLVSIGQVNLLEQIGFNNKGHFLYLKLEEQQQVSFIELVEWIDVMEKINRLEKFVKSRFQIKISDVYKNTAKFKIDKTEKLSEVFGQIEDYLEVLSIKQYHIRQISLEQIFVNILKDQENE